MLEQRGAAKRKESQAGICAYTWSDSYDAQLPRSF